jgi:hypothetical protein
MLQSGMEEGAAETVDRLEALLKELADRVSWAGKTRHESPYGQSAEYAAQVLAPGQTGRVMWPWAVRKR